MDYTGKMLMALSVKFASLTTAAVAVAAALSGCNSTESAVEQGMSNLQTNAAIESRLISDYELIKTVSSQIDQSNIYDERMQPRNYKQACLLPFMVADSENSALYWDGNCSKGRAVGLGRVVRTVGDKKVSEHLVEIDPKVKDTLVSYLRFDTGRSESEIGYSIISLKDGRLNGYSATLGYNDQDWLNGNYEFSYRFEDTPNFVSYTRIVDMLSGEYSSIIAYPNYSHDLLNASDNVLSSIYRTYRLLEGRTMIGISYIWLKDGQLVIKDNASGQDRLASNHPQELEDFVQDIQNKVTSRVDTVTDEIDRGFAKVEQYALARCKRPVAFFKGDEVNQVCDYLFNLNAAYEQLIEAKEMRSHQIDSFRQNQEQRLQEINRHLRGLNHIKLSSPKGK